MNAVNIPDRLCLLNSNKEITEELVFFLKEQNFKNIALITSKTPNHLITNEIELALLHKIEKLKTFSFKN